MKFLLFDIDGTLVDTGGAGEKSLNSAFEELFSIQDGFRNVSMAGKTDLQIIREGLGYHGIPHDNGVVPRFCEAYIRHLSAVIDPARGHLKPGIRDVLVALSARSDVVLGLLTGNIESGAQIKLDAFGIFSYFSVGAFGNDNEDRNLLLPIAVEKLKTRKAIHVHYPDCMVIGDTPRDVMCAKPYGALSVAVATGPYSLESLAEAGPDVLLENLSDTAAFLSLVG